MSWTQMVARYDVTESVVPVVEGTSFSIAHVKDLTALVDSMGPEDMGPDDRLPYWASLWPASIGLAQFIYEELPHPLGAVVELGAGLGVGSIAAARCGGAVTATDHEEHALEFVRRNAELNRVAVATRYFDWRDRQLPVEPAPLVIAADVLYEPRNVPMVASAIQALLAPDGLALVADPGRPHLPSFREALAARGLAVDVAIAADILVLCIAWGTAPTATPGRFRGGHRWRFEAHHAG